MAALVGMVVVAACSLGACLSQSVSSDASAFGVFGSVAITAVLGIVGLVSFGRDVRRRAVPPQTTHAPSVVGIVLTVVLGFGFGFFDLLAWLFASPMSFGFGGWGRPLRIAGGKALTPDVRASTEWARGPRPDVSGLSAEARLVLRELWLHDARKEHASVPAFGQVARQLVVLGAPSDLVRRAHLSCLQEIDHAERCFALASAYAGEDLGVQAMPELGRGGGELPRDRGKALAQVATEALVDGALLEDFNAELARTALADVTDPAAREALVRIVEDEAEHARLAWDILAYCVAEGGAPVARALQARYARVEDRVESLYEKRVDDLVAALADKEVLYRHGRVRREVVLDVYRERRAHVTRRLAEILGTGSAAKAA
ncbi:MAG: hypothetical protein JWP97_1915 [Labilithrix sp.]|nr:hypothetical protein [Labilithrix sp.]